MEKINKVDIACSECDRPIALSDAIQWYSRYYCAYCYEVNLPELGERRQCERCEDKIQWNGVLWQHVKSWPNHTGIPKRANSNES